MPVSFACWDWLVLFSAGAWKGEGRRALGCLALWCMALVNKDTITHSSSAAVLPARHESPCAALHGPLNSILLVPRELVHLFQAPCLCCYLISLDLLVDPCSGFHGCDGGPKSGMSAVGRGVRERGCHWERWAFSPEDMLACLSKGAFHKAKGKKWL